MHEHSEFVLVRVGARGRNAVDAFGEEALFLFTPATSDVYLIAEAGCQTDPTPTAGRVFGFEASGGFDDYALALAARCYAWWREQALKNLNP